MRITEFLSARKRISPLIYKTYLKHSSFLSEKCNGDVFLKLENQQITGSFKVRGALNTMIQLDNEAREKGVITASTGNHAQGVGYGGKMRGIQATIVIPSCTPKAKIDSIKRYGVKLVIHGEEYMDAEFLARKMEKKEGMYFISGYNDPQIIAGQGTIGLEMLQDEPDLDVILVPVGGGGLVSGISLAVKALNPKIEVLGVQSVASPVMFESLRQGKIIEMELKDSVAEGLHGGIVDDSMTFDICRENLDDLILVKEESILEAIAANLIYDHQVVEGAGAVVSAAIIEDSSRFSGKKIGCVVSGGNIDNELLRRAIQKNPTETD